MPPFNPGEAKYQRTADKCELFEEDINHISPIAPRVLTDREFPGNVRELENIIERGVIFCKGDTLEQHDLFINDINDTF